MSADLVYDYLTQRPTETSDVGFRLMPDKQQVKAALRMYSDAGQSITSLRGVPVFQAEDLSVKVENEVTHLCLLLVNCSAVPRHFLEVASIYHVHQQGMLAPDQQHKMTCRSLPRFSSRRMTLMPL